MSDCYENTQSREQVLLRLIADSRHELQLKRLNDDEHEDVMQIWSERLKRIPDRYLERVFALAMERHKMRSALIPAELLEAWSDFEPKANQERIKIAQDRDCVNRCSVDGWVVTDGDGLLVTGSTPPDVMTYGRPCPLHRR